MEQKQIVDQSDFRRGNLEDVGKKIPLETVRSWTNNYRRNNDKSITTSHFFGKNTIAKILAQDGCVGIRIHYAVDEKNQKQLILSGVDSTGHDQLPHQNHMIKEASENQILSAQADNEDMSGGNQFYDQSWPCPQTQGCPGAV